MNLASFAIGNLTRRPARTLLTVLSVALGYGTWRYVASLSGEQKIAIKDAINNVFIRAEARGTFPKAPAFERDYHSDYPGLRLLEENHKVVRDECVKLLGIIVTGPGCIAPRPSVRSSTSRPTNT